MPLSTQRLIATQPGVSAECVLIHGWGMSGCVWQPWLSCIRSACHVTVLDLPGYGDSETMNYRDNDALLRDCVESLPEKAIYIGYSLGGMLAMMIARRFPERVQAVATIAANLKFVADEHWSCAMPQETFNTFYSTVAARPKQALKRFLSLQVNGAEQPKVLLNTLSSSLEQTPTASAATLTQSLDLLAAIDNTVLVGHLQAPMLHIFGERDCLVPISARSRMMQGSSVQAVVIAGAPHCVFLSHPEQTWRAVYQFLVDEQLLEPQTARCLDKRQVARSFSRAAATYDSVADLQRQVGQHLLSYLPERATGTVLDLGCGTGHFSALLRHRYPNSHVIGLDLAEGMVGYASTHHQSDNASWLCADAENIALADNSVDIIFSSLAIQWCEDYTSLFNEIARVLKPGGCFVVSTLGPNTLRELRQAWQAVDNYTHVNQFNEQSVLTCSAQQAGLVCREADRTASDQQCHELTITLEYDNLKSLTRELKSLGAHNVNSGRPSGLTGKARLKALIDAYDMQRNQRGMLPASYQVWCCVWHKP